MRGKPRVNDRRVLSGIVHEVVGKPMTDNEIAGMLAAQTAIINLLCRELIQSGLVDQNDLTTKLYDLINRQATAYAGKGPSARSAPIRHLISLIEKD